MLGNWNDVHRRENDLNKAWGFTRRANVKINKPDIDAESSQKHNVEWEKASSRRTKPQRHRLKNWTLNTSKEGQCMQVGIRSRTPVTFSFFSWVVGACLFVMLLFILFHIPENGIIRQKKKLNWSMTATVMGLGVAGKTPQPAACHTSIHASSGLDVIFLYSVSDIAKIEKWFSGGQNSIFRVTRLLWTSLLYV